MTQLQLPAISHAWAWALGGEEKSGVAKNWGVPASRRPTAGQPAW